ncbi:glycosyltransferase family 61 protein [Paenibacillus sp. UMB4589-SE434]|uniref:glycosyltransferase family 61 protein n=1 Tax=Paenibacillus sp. UMB4589-SE434 TaxID=3046314 RepID=UPI00254DB158|nr:glycosyltransferase family 61 protein [Paenibacillus sp. UMB4589-SE434]MDK8183041.1 glycosyltransferase family 61 protein [Paenibacillus sp. UMB4589-SE434]
MYTIPELYYDKTIDWVIDTVTDIHLIHHFYKVIHPKEILHLPPPKGIDPVRWPTACSFDDAYVAVIPQGRLVTSNCYVVTPNNKRLRDVEYYYDYPFRQLPAPEYKAGTVATLVWGWNIPDYVSTQAIYGHWFFDILPRIHLIEQSGIPISKYVIGKLTHAFQYESLELLGMSLDRLLQVDRLDFHLKAELLVVPSVPLLTGKSPRWAYQFIQARLKEHHAIPKKPGYERIYISRQDAFARYVVNEDEVIQYLQQKGFTTVVLTPLTMREKISIFSTVEVVVAPFGSGNANLAFCNPGTKVVELAPTTVIDPYFWRISCHAQLDYYEVVCEIEEPPKPIGGADSLIVDLNKLDQVLRLAGI